MSDPANVSSTSEYSEPSEPSECSEYSEFSEATSCSGGGEDKLSMNSGQHPESSLGLTERILSNSSVQTILHSSDISMALQRKWTVGGRVDTMRPAGVVALAQGMALHSSTAAPTTIATVLKAYLPILLRGFAELDVETQHGLIALWVPTETAFEHLRTVAATHETMCIKETFRSKGIRHIWIGHDEGEGKLLVYAWWKEDGYIQGPILLGSIAVGKKGSENADGILQLLGDAGVLDEDAEGNRQVSCSGMSVDGAGAKSDAMLRGIGLIFTVLCDLHVLALMAGCFNVAFGVAKIGSAHPFNLAFDLINLIRKWVGVGKYFEHLTDALNRKLRENGADATINVSRMQVQGRVALVNRAMESRWETVEQFAIWILSPRLLLFTEPMYRNFCDGLPQTRLDIIRFSLHVLYDETRDGWWSRRSANTGIYGNTAHILRLQSYLKDNYTLAQLGLVSDIYLKEFRTFFVESRRLPDCTRMLAFSEYRLERLCALDVGKCATFQMYIQKLKLQEVDGLVEKAEERDKKVRQLELGGSATIEAMRAKQLEHLSHWRINQLPLALGDARLGPFVAVVMYDFMRDSFPYLALEALGPSVTTNSLPGPVYSLNGREAVTSKTDIQSHVRAALNSIADPLTIPWVSHFQNNPVLRDEFCTWTRSGLSNRSISEKGEWLTWFDEVLTVGPNTTLAVESGVGSGTLVNRVGGKAMTSSSSSDRQQVYEAGLRCARHANSKLPKLRHSHQRGGRQSFRLPPDKSEDSCSGRTWERPSKSKSSIFERLNAVEASTNQEAFKLAVKQGKDRLSASRSEHEAKLVRGKVHASRKANLRVHDNYEAKLAQADQTRAQAEQTPEPSAFGLKKLTNNYPKTEMIATLTALRVREHADRMIDSAGIGDFDSVQYRQSLQPHTAAEVRRLLVNAFFGLEWDSEPFEYSTGKKVYPHAPGQGSKQEQDHGVAKAMAMCSSALLHAGQAWSWKTQTRAEVEKARTHVDAVLGSVGPH